VPNQRISKKLNISKENKVKIIETRGMAEVAELIKRANLVVSPDTSIVHLARAFDKKMICIYRKELGKEDKNSILWGPNSEKAKVIFEKLLSEYPDRMRLLLCIAYCEVYLGNKEGAIYYLKKVEVGQDEKYYLTTDDIADYQVFEAYYVLGEYDLFLEECEKAILDYYFADWDHYFYTLWIKNENEKFNKYIEKYKNEMLEAIEEAKIDDDFSDEEERQDYIKSYEEDLEKLMTMSNKIQNGNYKPKIELKLYPEYGCFLIDCIRHNF